MLLCHPRTKRRDGIGAQICVDPAESAHCSYVGVSQVPRRSRFISSPNFGQRRKCKSIALCWLTFFFRLCCALPRVIARTIHRLDIKSPVSGVSSECVVLEQKKDCIVLLYFTLPPSVAFVCTSRPLRPSQLSISAYSLILICFDLILFHFTILSFLFKFSYRCGEFFARRRNG